MGADKAAMRDPSNSFKQVGVRAGSDKDLFFVGGPVDQQEIACHVAITMVDRGSLQKVIQIFGGKRSVVRDQQQQGLFETMQVELARMGPIASSPSETAWCIRIDVAG
jgi:hypothetical protein